MTTGYRNNREMGKTTHLGMVIGIISVLGFVTIVHQQSMVQRFDQIPAFASSPQMLERRIEILETKLNSYLSFGQDPFLDVKTPAVCHNSTELNEYCPTYKKDKGCHLGMKVCLDKITPNDCIVYDFGIRPDFGEILSQPPFNCKVFALDPSPITQKWYERNPVLKDNPNYNLLFFGAGAKDETIQLKEYNWDQVSIYNYPTRVVDPSRCDKDHCKYKLFEVQKIHNLPVRGLASIMHELGHDHIDILKLDIEGSEYRFLEPAIESGVCQRIGQLAIKWHHFDEDSRYGHTSSPQLNMFVALLKKYCGLQQFWVYSSGSWPSNEKIYADMGVTLRYAMSSFMKV
jgi:FkbM family methyltransferase